MSHASDTGPDPLALESGGLLTIDLDALAANYRLLRDRVVPARCAAVVKADGYGLGAPLVARRLQAEGCRDFFVAQLGEGIALRPHLGDDCRILVLNGPFPGSAAFFERHRLLPVLNSLEQIAEWQALSAMLGRRLDAAMQTDTGMSRYGLSGTDLRRIADEPHRLDGIRPSLLMSHLGCADTPGHPMNRQQIERFCEHRALLRGALGDVPASLAASSGIMLGPEAHFDMVRPGAALYGVNPGPGANPMHPVVRLQGRVVQTRWIEPGTSVGYGARFTAQRRTRIATLAVGYADGFLRAGGGAGIATLPDDPTALPVVGRISMDCLGLDVTALGDRELAAGSLIDLIGPHRPLDDAAAAAGTIGYEMLTALGSRHQRRVFGQQA
ncbi:alanine racemase [Lichenicoccus roseus]|uniref:Alanine racemase n=1 Tax=Lichenicoccus roseus TaxID=2683649 RepID=A0A5R9JBS6_9PROT|nr:alanine racemase [Lichenicoccus roseus]TLU73071.1 alanine racemase [Lichenicoccus roseus]